jgi:hypothetical protein
VGQPNIHIGVLLEKVEIIKHAMSSAAEAETGALSQGQQGGYAILTNSHWLNHPQPPTPIQTDNLTAASVVNKTIKQKRSKAPMGVRF